MSKEPLVSRAGGNEEALRRSEERFQRMVAEVQDYAPDGWFLPFIVYSPDITGRHYVHDTCYQMDIFPTLMAVNGGETYYWQGFGNNLLADKKRNESEEVLFDASAKMIKSDFFRTVENE
jgi:hypothetical protein